MGVFGTWVAMFIDWFVRGGLYIYRYFSNKWTEYRWLHESDYIFFSAEGHTKKQPFKLHELISSEIF